MIKPNGDQRAGGSSQGISMEYSSSDANRPCDLWIMRETKIAIMATITADRNAYNRLTK